MFTDSRNRSIRFLLRLVWVFLAAGCWTSTFQAAEQPSVVLSKRTQGHDWPTFLGPTGDSKSQEKGILVPWPKDGPKIVWKKPLNESYCIGSVSHGRYLQPDFKDGQAILYCWNAETGKPIWEYSYPSVYRDIIGYDRGPRCSPVVDGNRVYQFGVEGMLHCLNLTTGEKLWNVNTTTEFGVVQNFFGVGSTPVVFKDLLIVMVGGSPPDDQNAPPGRLDRVTGNGTAIVAFDKMTGKIKYQSGDELASYASLKLAEHSGRPWCFAFARGGLVGFHPQTGKIDFRFPWRARILESVNASVPVVVGNQVFISETYGPGSALLEFKTGSYEIVWQDDVRKRHKSMQTHWNTPIYHEGYVYGSSGRHEYNAELRCIEWDTGKVMWSEPGLTRCSLLYVDNHFICLGEDGTLRLLQVDPEKYNLISEVVYRDQPLPEGAVPNSVLDLRTRMLKPPAWAAPILAHGLLYVRGSDQVVCLEVIRDRP